MFFLNALFQRGKYKRLYSSGLRFYASLYQKEFTVVPFCNIKVDLPINVTLKPLDVHKYKDCNKVIISIVSNSVLTAAESVVSQLQCAHNNGNISVTGDLKELHEEITCKIEAPVKANLDITTERNGNIDLSDFNGESIFLKSSNGNISASKCQCNKISISSSTGNITCGKVIQAADIHLKTQKYGSINAGRLQGLSLRIETENGDITTESSYCNKSTFTSQMGNLNLRNTHKDCKIVIKKNGKLNMNAFDGILNAYVNEGNATIQLSRILGKSEININGNSLLEIKLSETCLQETCFKVSAKDIQIDEDINKNLYCNIGEEFVLNPKDQADVVINGKQSCVKIQIASLMEMFNLKLSSS